MIEQGKEQGWLRLPIETLRPWAKLNGALFNGVGVGTQSGYEDRGSTIISRQKLVADGSLEPLMVVPRDLILSLERVQEHAKCDRDFLAVLDALGDFGRVSHPARFVLSNCSSSEYILEVCLRHSELKRRNLDFPFAAMFPRLSIYA